MGIPVLIPSVDFLLKLNILEDNKVLRTCSSHDSHDGKSVEVIPSPPRHKNSAVTMDPESPDPEETKIWMKKMIYYTWPHVVQFSSWDNLMNLLNSTDWKKTHENMIAESHIRFRRSR
jgi:hypothetical protein